MKMPILARRMRRRLLSHVTKNDESSEDDTHCGQIKQVAPLQVKVAINGVFPPETTAQHRLIDALGVLVALDQKHPDQIGVALVGVDRCSRAEATYSHRVVKPMIFLFDDRDVAIAEEENLHQLDGNAQMAQGVDQLEYRRGSQEGDRRQDDRVRPQRDRGRVPHALVGGGKRSQAEQGTPGKCERQDQPQQRDEAVDDE